MWWIIYILFFTLFLIVLLALIWQTIRNWGPDHKLELLREKLAVEGGVLTDCLDNLTEDFDGTLYYYRPVIYDRDKMESLALSNLIEDLRIMSGFVGFGESVGWGKAFEILGRYRVRLIIGRVALFPSATEEFRADIDKLFDDLKVFTMLQGFRRKNIREHAPYELSDDEWDELSLAKSQVVKLQERALNLMQVIEQERWRAAE